MNPSCFLMVTICFLIIYTCYKSSLRATGRVETGSWGDVLFNIHITMETGSAYWVLFVEDCRCRD